MRHDRLGALRVAICCAVALHVGAAGAAGWNSVGGPGGGIFPSLASPKAQARGGRWTHGSYGNSYGSRAFYLYVPSKYDGSAPLPLMVMLHGCFQAAEDFATITGMNEVAEEYGFAVIYPEQTYADNVWKCWNWFKPENQARNSGELSIIMGIMGEVAQSVRIDTTRVYVTGLSAGASLASNLLACYSDVFAGAGIASGTEFEAANSEAEAHVVTAQGSNHNLKQSAADAIRCTGPGARLSAVIAIHGVDDTFVNPINTEHVVEQFTDMNDYLDDGLFNGSQNLRTLSSRSGQVPWGHPYTMNFYGGNGQIHIAKVLVGGMNHAWSGATMWAPYADPMGPNASEMIWAFLSRYSSRVK